jgi:hypothetical protein
LWKPWRRGTGTKMMTAFLPWPTSTCNDISRQINCVQGRFSIAQFFFKKKKKGCRQCRVGIRNCSVVVRSLAIRSQSRDVIILLSIDVMSSNRRTQIQRILNSTPGFPIPICIFPPTHRP